MKHFNFVADVEIQLIYAPADGARDGQAQYSVCHCQNDKDTHAVALTIAHQITFKKVATAVLATDGNARPPCKQSPTPLQWICVFRAKCCDQTSTPRQKTSGWGTIRIHTAVGSKAYSGLGERGITAQAELMWVNSFNGCKLRRWDPQSSCSAVRPDNVQNLRHLSHRTDLQKWGGRGAWGM